MTVHCTAGIDLGGEVRMVGANHAIGFVDAQGFDGSPELDARIFTPALLLSRVVLLNTKSSPVALAEIVSSLATFVKVAQTVLQSSERGGSLLGEDAGIGLDHGPLFGSLIVVHRDCENVLPEAATEALLAPHPLQLNVDRMLSILKRAFKSISGTLLASSWRRPMAARDAHESSMCFLAAA
jgi:hypothetical protein